jgi:hypothetical protein
VSEFEELFRRISKEDLSSTLPPDALRELDDLRKQAENGQIEGLLATALARLQQAQDLLKKGRENEERDQQQRQREPLDQQGGELR